MITFSSALFLMIRIKHFFVNIAAWLLLSACASHYNISGDLSQGVVKAEKLYLAVVDDENQRVFIDSCEIVHGQFSFAGQVDSIVLGHLDVDGATMMPVVIEQGEVDISVDVFGTGITGGVLNKKLSDYYKALNVIQQEWVALYQRRVKLMRDGTENSKDFEDIMLAEDSLNRATEKLQADFILENFNNVLGPGIFMMICDQYPIPMITPQLRSILNQAPPMFLRHPRISRFIRRAGYVPMNYY